jgi:hypothetical protein
MVVEPSTIFVICPETETLVVHPDYVEDTQKDLGAVVVSKDEWLVNGIIYKVQKAGYVLATPSNGVEVARESLKPVRARGVALVSDSVAATCSTKVSGYVCSTFDCSGCAGGNQKSGGSMTYCQYTGVSTDTCTLTGASKTCKITSYANSDCTGAVLATSSVNYNSCQ